jgi:hypothetical protein
VVHIFSDIPLSSKIRSSSYPRPLEGIALKDDQGTIFFFRGQEGRKLDTVILNITPIFAPNIIERRIKASAELSKKIFDGTTTRSDISNVFFSLDYFKKLAELHSNMACR